MCSRITTILFRYKVPVKALIPYKKQTAFMYEYINTLQDIIERRHLFSNIWDKCRKTYNDCLHNTADHI